jgi:type 1 glutamine amidotransferase
MIPQLTQTGQARKPYHGAAVPAFLAALALAAAPAGAAKFKALNFWGVGGFAHGARFSANTLMDSLAKVMDVTVDKTDQSTVFTTANLAQYSVVILNNVTEPGKKLNTDQQAALLEFMKKKGLVAIHGSADTKGTWAAFTTSLGGELSSHGVGVADMNVECANKRHPLLAGLPAQNSLNEEWYAYKTNPRITPGVQVLVTLDEASCTNCTKMAGGDHPIAWTKVDPAGGGRMFYMAMGHFDHVWQKDAFSREMLKNAILWTGGEGIATVTPDPAGCATGTISPVPFALKDAVIAIGIGSLRVDIAREGAHEVRVFTLAGKTLHRRVGRGPARHAIEGLQSGAIYTVSITTRKGRESRLIAIP